MKFEYKVIRETEIRNLEPQFNVYGKGGWRVVSVVWENDEPCFVATFEKTTKKKLMLYVQRTSRTIFGFYHG